MTITPVMAAAVKRANKILNAKPKKVPKPYENVKHLSVWLSPTGVSHVVRDMKAFCTEHNLNHCTMFSVIIGKRFNEHKGWTVHNEPALLIKPKTKTKRVRLTKNDDVRLLKTVTRRRKTV